MTSDIHHHFYNYILPSEPGTSLEQIQWVFNYERPKEGVVPPQNHISFNKVLERATNKIVASKLQVYQLKQEKDLLAKEAKRAKAKAIKEANAEPVTLTKGQLDDLLKSFKKLNSKPVKPKAKQQSNTGRKALSPKSKKATKSKPSPKSNSGKKQNFRKSDKGLKGRGQEKN